LCRYEFGVGRNHREIDYGEEAESEGEDQEREKQQEGCPGAQKEEVLGKEGWRKEERKKERRQEVEREESRSEESQGQKSRIAQESCAQASSSGCTTSGSGTGAIMVAVRIELRQQRQQRFLIPGRGEYHLPSPRPLARRMAFCAVCRWPPGRPRLHTDRDLNSIALLSGDGPSAAPPRPLSPPAISMRFACRRLSIS
jgi:hypothetical protein